MSLFYLSTNNTYNTYKTIKYMYKVVTPCNSESLATVFTFKCTILLASWCITLFLILIYVSLLTKKCMYLVYKHVHSTINLLRYIQKHTHKQSSTNRDGLLMFDGDVMLMNDTHHRTQLIQFLKLRQQ